MPDGIPGPGDRTDTALLSRREALTILDFGSWTQSAFHGVLIHGMTKLSPCARDQGSVDESPVMLQHVHFRIYKLVFWPSTAVPCDELTMFPRGTAVSQTTRAKLNSVVKVIQACLPHFS